jgi:predicted HTH transcriptional regulator
MLNNSKGLLERIRLGEDSFFELKEVRFAGDRVAAPHRDSLADSLAAFANSRGGVCVLGVDDSTRKIVGIPLEMLDRAEDFVREVCNDSIDPPLLPAIERVLLPGSGGAEVPLLKIDVPRSLFVHRSPGGYFYRVGSSKRQMSPEYLARLFQQRSQAGIIPFDEQIVPRATLAELSKPLWERFRSPRSTEENPETLLRKLRITRQDEDGVWRPTVAGVLLTSEDPRRFLPNAFIQAVAYAGVSVVPAGVGSVYQLDAADIAGPLDRQVADACRFVARNMRVAGVKNVGRTDIPQYDITAVFEAVVNAVAHRDYAIYGSKIRLRAFADRLELHSPGGLTNTMTIDSLPFLQSARNELVTSLLARCPVPSDLPWLDTGRVTMMDKRGEGVPIILERSTALSGRQPEYRLIDDAELLLTIYAASPQEEGRIGATRAS